MRRCVRHLSLKTFVGGHELQLEDFLTREFSHSCSQHAVPLRGRELAATIRERLRTRSEALHRSGPPPTLGILLVGDDSASHAYVATITRVADRCGIAVTPRYLEQMSTTEHVAHMLQEMGEDRTIDGVMLQQPLPTHLDAAQLTELIPPAKDVDGATTVSQGHLALGSGTLLTPATPLAVMLLLEQSRLWPIVGRDVVVVGKSNVVGLPLTLLLLAAGATVTVTHKETRDLAAHTRNAEVVIAAAGSPGLITGEMLRPGATVIDVGTTLVGDRLVGDVDSASAECVAGEISPVPGGVGPLTTVALLQNVIVAAERRRG